jgi:hypothetical protein
MMHTGLHIVSWLHVGTHMPLIVAAVCMTKTIETAADGLPLKKRFRKADFRSAIVLLRLKRGTAAAAAPWLRDTAATADAATKAVLDVQALISFSSIPS